MILAFHSIFSTYGFWMPNDPRGSGSNYVAAWELFRYGNATKTTSRRSVAGSLNVRAWQSKVKQSLKYPPVRLTGRQAVAAVAGFAKACCEGEFQVHACAILPDHVHLVIGWHQRNIRAIVGHMKSNATRRLKEEQLWPQTSRPIWGAHGWNVFLYSSDDVNRAIEYVNANPLKEGKKMQTWSFVTPFDLSKQSTARRKRRGEIEEVSAAPH